MSVKIERKPYRLPPDVWIQPVMSNHWVVYVHNGSTPLSEPTVVDSERKAIYITQDALEKFVTACLSEKKIASPPTEVKKVEKRAVEKTNSIFDE